MTLREKTCGENFIPFDIVLHKIVFQKTSSNRLTLSFTFMHMCMITLSANIFLNKGQKFLHFFLQINYKTVYWKIFIISGRYDKYFSINEKKLADIICWFFFMWIITYINKGLKLFSFFLKNFKNFKLNYYVQNSNSKITKYVSKDTIL